MPTDGNLMIDTAMMLANCSRNNHYVGKPERNRNKNKQAKKARKRNRR